jgi:hypothetical protein
MTDITFTDAIAAAASVAALVESTPPVVEDSMERYVREGATSRPSAILRQAASAVDSGVTTTFELTRDDASLRLTAEKEGTWRLSGDIALVLPHLSTVQQQTNWRTEELLGGGGEQELDGADDARLRIEIHKPRWSEPIARETGRNTWIGPGLDGFATWLCQSNPKAVVNNLFGGRAGALVLLGDWVGTPIECGPRLALGDLGTRAKPPIDPPTLTARLADRDDVLPLPYWRAIEIEPADLPDRLRVPLERLVAITAIALIAEEEEPGRLRPSARETTIWEALPATVGSTVVQADAIVQLARWVGDELSQARLDAARHVAATAIPDPLSNPDGERIVEIARTTYHLIVHRDALASLDHQQKLEEAFHELDAKAEELRSKLIESLDATVTKVLAAALAIAIAALASPKVRNLPATIAAVVLALYLAFSGWSLATWYREDAENRLTAAKATAAGRLRGVGIDLEAIATEWLADLLRRIKVAAVILFLLASVVVLGGLAAEEGLRRDLGIESANPKRSGTHTVVKRPAQPSRGLTAPRTKPGAK